MYMKYWVELGIKHIEKGEKIHILGIFGSCVPVHPFRTEYVPLHVRGVPVHVRGVPVHPVLIFLFRPVLVFYQ